MQMFTRLQLRPTLLIFLPWSSKLENIFFLIDRLGQLAFVERRGMAHNLLLTTLQTEI